jgi:hypothetical protein
MNVKPFARRVALVMGTVATSGRLVAFPLRIAGATSADPTPKGPKPTIVLVHGAWADA